MGAQGTSRGYKVRVGVQGPSRGGTRYEWVRKVQAGAQGTSGCTWYEWVHKVQVWAACKRPVFAAAVVAHFFACVLYGRLK